MYLTCKRSLVAGQKSCGWPSHRRRGCECGYPPQLLPTADCNDLARTCRVRHQRIDRHRNQFCCSRNRLGCIGRGDLARPLTCSGCLIVDTPKSATGALRLDSGEHDRSAKSMQLSTMVEPWSVRLGCRAERKRSLRPILKQSVCR